MRRGLLPAGGGRLDGRGVLRGQALQVPLGVDGGHAPRTGRGDGLPVDVILHSPQANTPGTFVAVPRTGTMYPLASRSTCPATSFVLGV